MKDRNEIGRMMTERGYKLAAEIGVQKGEFAKQILSHWDGHLVLVDAWREFPTEIYNDTANVSTESHSNNYNECLQNLREFEGRFTTCRGLSQETSELFKDELFDLVYIDANHSYDGCLADIKSWIKKVKKGGCICGHDYMDGITWWGGEFGVKSAVLNYFNRDPDILTQEEYQQSWFFFV